MKRTLWLSLLSIAVLATPALAETHVQVNIGLAPPPPVIVRHRMPPPVFVSEARVYVVDADDVPYDCFRFGAFFYVYNDGWWYRAPRYGGPYRAIEERYVPAQIWNVPEGRWKHHPHGMPPGQAKKYYGGRYGGEGHGRGHGRGHD
jgi:hypothetical protein